MRTGTPWNLGVVVFLLAIGPAMAQDMPPDRDDGPLPVPPLSHAPVHEAVHDKGPSFPKEHAHECGPGGLFLSAEYLLLKPRRRAFDFVIIDPVDDGIPEGVIENLDWQTRSGLRAGAGYRLPGEHWEIGVFYTYFHTNDSRSLAAPLGGTLYSTLTRPGTIEEVTSALALSNLDYDVLDAEIGRRYQVGESMAVRLFGGVRAAWIDQKVNAYYNGRDANQAHVFSQVNMDGFGLRLGAEGHWNVGRGVSLFGRGAGSLLVSDFRTRLFQSNDADATLQTNLYDKFDAVTPVTELAVGIGWEGEHLRLRAGYELTNWFSLVDLPDLVNDLHVGKTSRRVSDLSLQGLFLEVGLVY